MKKFKYLIGLILCNLFLMGNSQAATLLSATADFELTIHDIHISQINDIFTEKSKVRSRLTLSMYEYFNDYRYSITINDLVESGDPTIGTAKTDISFEVKKAAFLDWTGDEIDLINMAPGAPILYKELGDNLQLEWSSQLPELVCASTTFCTPSDLFTFIQNGVDTEDAKNLMMRVELTGYRNTSAVPIPAAVWLFGSGLIGLIGWSKRK